MANNTENNYTETDLGNISLNPRGKYDSSATYEYLDTVSYQGGSYFCLAELETTITGIAPDPGHNSEYWQMIALPGDMTPEYIAMHDDVINKAKQVETSRAAVELSQQEIESAQADVQQLHSNTVQAAQEAESSRDSATGYAQSAEQSRKAASESEQNINAQITGFDDKVTESVNQAKEEIGSTRQQAINAITSQQDTSVNTIKTEGEKIITKVEKDAKTVADDRAAVEAAAQTVADNAQEVAQNTQNVASNTASATASAESAKTSADNAAQSAKSVEVASEQIETNKEDIAGLKKDISNKITKFYASNQGENHLADSDDGKIMDMMLYGKSEQKQYTGKNLWNESWVDTTLSNEYSSWVDNTYLPGWYQHEIIPSKTYILSIDGKQTTCRYIFYDKNKVALGTYVNSDIMTAPQNAKYLTFRTSNTTFEKADQKIMVECDDTVTSYEPYTGGIPSPNPDYPQEIKSVVNPTVKVSNEDGTKSQTVTLPYTLNAIPVSSGGNVTIGGQQYIADYVDVERGKVVRTCIKRTFNTKNGRISEEYRLAFNISADNAGENGDKECIFSTFKWVGWETCVAGTTMYIKNIKKSNNELYTAQELKELSLELDVIYQLSEPQETDLTTEEIAAFKALATYYTTTNISVNSDELDGYTVFNYPISMENGWNYVKQQLNDNRDYIYDMDARTQDTDIQSAEAYVNSEYAVALTELEV